MMASIFQPCPQISHFFPWVALSGLLPGSSEWRTHPRRPRGSFHTHARQTLASSLGPTTLDLLKFVFHVSLHKYILIFPVLLYDWIFKFFFCCSLNMKLKNKKAWLRRTISCFHPPSGPWAPRPPARLAGLGLGWSVGVGVKVEDWLPFLSPFLFTWSWGRDPGRSKVIEDQSTLGQVQMEPHHSRCLATDPACFLTSRDFCLTRFAQDFVWLCHSKDFSRLTR